MTKKILSLVLVVCLCAAGLWAAPALAAQYYSARTPLAGSSAAKRGNIAAAIEAINGVSVPYGATFSFNETVGMRTRANGFVSAENGRGVQAIGGGVAQAATTLYLALLQVPGRIQFGPIATYGSRFADNYVSDGGQAIITDYDSTHNTDLSFTNLTDDMTLEMWMSDDYVYCAITVGQVSGGNWFSDFTPVQTPAPFRQPQLLAASSLYCGDEAALIHNVTLAAGCIDDTTLPGGGTFSFNDIVGPRTKAYGYKTATNGRGARVVGGGVAQVASVIWLAVKDMDDIAIVEKSTYGKKYNQSYVSSSADAILTDYKNSHDFSFRYTGAGSITLYVRVQNNALYCEVYRN